MAEKFTVFSNEIDDRTVRKALKKKQGFIKRFGDDSEKIYHLKATPIESLKEIPVLNLELSDRPLELEKNPLIVGNIRMGFGHYRISMAIASCARAMGFTPYWLDLASFDATGSKMIRAQNDLYSLGSRLSQKSKLFNSLVWEPMNCEGFRKLTYNVPDQKNSELLVPLFNDIPKDTPYVATHVWPSQGAVHAGLTHVVNAIPDNWPMALHLSEGAIHTVQTPFAYLGYKTLNGMAKKPLKHMPDGSLFEVGHYVDHELVSNIDRDCDERIRRMEEGKPVRFLLTVGGAGAGADLYLAMLEKLIPYVKQNKATVMINFGDHLNMYEYLKKRIPSLEKESTRFFDRYRELEDLAAKLESDSVPSGIYCIHNSDIFQAVYSTNLLMRFCDVLVTKPSELSFYPVPKLMMRHIGGHEVYGALHAQEIGDSTFECDTVEKLSMMTDSLIEDRSLVISMSRKIKELGKNGIYNGGYEVVKLAAGIR